MKRDNDDNVILRGNGVAAVKIVIDDISWFVKKFTPNLEGQPLVADQMLSEIATELKYEELTVFRKLILNNGF